MSSMDHKRALDQDQAREHIASTVFSDSVGGPELGRIGLEPEYLTFRVDKSGAPLGRLPLEGPSSVLSALQERVGPGQLLREDTAGPPPVYTLENGGRITFEPGAQVEHSTAVHDTAASAMDDVDHVASELAAILGTVDGQLASVGLDLWTDRSLVEQQLRADRYNCMAAYLDSRSQEGRVMMRHTGSFQINLDLGEKGVAAERWRLSNLLTPVALASFACSPEDGWASRRAKAWQGLDPTRTGFPACLLAGERTDPGECYAELALKADVLMFHDPQSGKSFPGTPGFRFVDWLEQGHPQVGFPGIEQLNAHLTTLFPEVRLRGFLEIRSTDAVPLKWRAAQVVFWTGLIYDREARRACLELLEPHITELAQDWTAAAMEGLGKPGLQQQAVAVWELALAGASRLPAGYFRAQDLQTAASYLAHFVARGRSAGDDLREKLKEGPAQSLSWAL